jgi:predicted HicB family RNase H-like nuclease
VRVPPVLHRLVAIKAAALKESMKKYLEDLMLRDTLDIENICGATKL